MYICDDGNHRIRKVLASTSLISTIAGTGVGTYSGDNGLANNTALNHPVGVAVDASGKSQDHVYLLHNLHDSQSIR